MNTQNKLISFYIFEPPLWYIHFSIIQWVIYLLMNVFIFDIFVDVFLPVWEGTFFVIYIYM